MIQSITKSIGGIMNPITDEKKDDNGRISLDDARVNVALLLLFLSGDYWNSLFDPEMDVFRVSKSVLLKDLNRLAADGMVTFKKSSRSVFLTNPGIDKAFDLLVQFSRKFNVDIYNL
jgi:hypothetical protein